MGNGHNVVHFSAGGRQPILIAVFTQWVLGPVSLGELSPLGIIVSLTLRPLGLNSLTTFIARRLASDCPAMANSSHDDFSKSAKKCKSVLGCIGHLGISIKKGTSPSVEDVPVVVKCQAVSQSTARPSRLEALPSRLP